MSVVEQGLESSEHIIVDGGSDDGTLDIVNGYPHLSVISEPDNGVYDALNKGIQQAKGDVIGFLNSDDFYERASLKEVVRVFAENEQLDTLCGGTRVIELGERGVEVVAVYRKPEETELSFRNITVGVPLTNARFFRKRVFERIGLFDSKYRIAGDREFLVRAALARLKGRHMDIPVYCYRCHPGSLTFNSHNRNVTRKLDEYLQIIDKYRPEGDLAPSMSSFLKLWQSQVHFELSIVHLRRRSLRVGLVHLMQGREWLKKRIRQGMLRQMRHRPLRAIRSDSA